MSTVNPQLQRQWGRYKEFSKEKLCPDLGMSLALEDFSKPLIIGSGKLIHYPDRELGFLITGTLQSHGRVGDNGMAKLPLFMVMLSLR